MTALKTTRPVMAVRTIEDVIAIESRPYDELVTARNLYDLFLATAASVGTQKALTVLRSPDPLDVGTSLTHTQLLGEITRAANMFRSLGLNTGDGVAAFLTPTLPELQALLIGAQVAGVAATLNYLLTEDAIVDLLTAQGATILVAPARALDEGCWTKAVAAFQRVPTLQTLIVIGDDVERIAGAIPLDAALGGHRADALDFEPSRDRDTVCALFHTGGTTGRPKVVRLTHGNQIHAAFGFAQVYGYDERDVVINGFPFFHVGGTMTVGLAVLAAGGHIVVPSPYGMRSPAAVERHWELVRHFRATVIGGVPTTIAALTNSWRDGDDVSTVRMAATGGAVLPRAVGARFEAATGIPLFETYGMTETAAAIAFNPGRGTPVAGSVGFRAPFSQTRIMPLDPARSAPCEAEETGLVQVRGSQIFPGYLDPAHNAGTLDADGWLTTGDVGYLTGDARLVLTGREKDLIIRSGHNIDPATIEDVANQFPGVHISAAVGMPDQYAGEVPALFVVAAPGVLIDPGALRAHLERHVHEPPARPKTILAIDALPVTAVGKIFKPALRDLAIQEKVRIEAEAACGRGVAVEVDVRLDERKRTLVEVIVDGASTTQIAALDAALKPLPQTYSVRAAAPAAAEAVTLSLDAGVAILTLNRPDSMNAFSQAQTQALERQVQALAAMPDLRAVIVTGAGRAFCAGGDLIEFEQALAAGTLVETLSYNQNVLTMVEELPVPVIAAVNGVAIAGGLELILCCDIVIAAEDARIGDGHARYAIVPAGGATVRLLEKLSAAHAAQLFYTAATVDAATLRQWGLVNETVASDRLMDRAMQVAREIAARSPEAIRHIKALTRRTDPGRTARLRAEIEHFAEHLDGRDLARGLAAFRQRQTVIY
ncbi:MAG: AMP-binding protein [Rhizobiaceae bacterium]